MVLFYLLPLTLFCCSGSKRALAALAPQLLLFTKCSLDRSSLSKSTNLKEKIKVIDRDSRVKSFFRTHSDGVFGFLEEDELFLIKCVVAAGQEHLLRSDEFEFQYQSKKSSLKTALYGLAEMIENWDANEGIVKNVGGAMIDDEEMKALRLLVKNLGEVEHFYDCIGGIIGLVLCCFTVFCICIYGPGL